MLVVSTVSFGENVSLPEDSFWRRIWTVNSRGHEIARYRGVAVVSDVVVSDCQLRRGKRREPWDAIFGLDGLANMYFWIRNGTPKLSIKGIVIPLSLVVNTTKPSPFDKALSRETPNYQKISRQRRFKKRRPLFLKQDFPRLSTRTASDCGWVYAWKKGEMSCRQLQGLHRVRRSQRRHSFLACRPACAHTKAW